MARPRQRTIQFVLSIIVALLGVGAVAFAAEDSPNNADSSAQTGNAPYQHCFPRRAVLPGIAADSAASNQSLVQAVTAEDVRPLVSDQRIVQQLVANGWGFWDSDGNVSAQNKDWIAARDEVYGVQIQAVEASPTTCNNTTPTSTVTTTATATKTQAGTVTGTPPTQTNTPTATNSPTRTPTLAPGQSPSPTATNTNTPTPSPTGQATATNTPVTPGANTPTHTPSPTNTPVTPSPTATNTTPPFNCTSTPGTTYTSTTGVVFTVNRDVLCPGDLVTIDFTWNTELSAMSISVDMDRTIYPSEAGEPAFWAPMTLANGKWSMSFTARQSAECQQSDECPQIGPKVPDSTIKSFILQLKVEKDGVTSFPGYTIKDN